MAGRHPRPAVPRRRGPRQCPTITEIAIHSQPRPHGDGCENDAGQSDQSLVPRQAVWRYNTAPALRFAAQTSAARRSGWLKGLARMIVRGFAHDHPRGRDPAACPAVQRGGVNVAVGGGRASSIFCVTSWRWDSQELLCPSTLSALTTRQNGTTKMRTQRDAHTRVCRCRYPHIYLLLVCTALTGADERHSASLASITSEFTRTAWTQRLVPALPGLRGAVVDGWRYPDGTTAHDACDRRADRDALLRLAAEMEEHCAAEWPRCGRRSRGRVNHEARR